jgi:hypothetical protein
MAHIEPNLLQVQLIDPQGGKGQRRLKLLGQTVLALDVLVEQLEESDEHYLMGVQDHWLLNYQVDRRLPVDIVVVLENHEVLPLEVQLRVDEIYVERGLVHLNGRFLAHFVTHPHVVDRKDHAFPQKDEGVPNGGHFNFSRQKDIV